MVYDFTTQLSTIASCSGTFIAIIGGLVANKVIALSTEKKSAQNRIKQIDDEYKKCEKRIEELSKWLDDYDAEEYVGENLDSLLELKELSEVYIDTPDNSMGYDDLLPYWNKSLNAVKLLKDAVKDTSVWENLDTNGVPKVIIDKLDKFQYNICSKYDIALEFGEFHLYRPTSVTASTMLVEIYNQNMSDMKENIDKRSFLLTEQILLAPKAEMLVDTSTKKGMLIFGITALLNVILPVILMIFNPTTSACWYNVERIISVVLFIIGMITMCSYIYSLFPKKEEKEREGK